VRRRRHAVDCAALIDSSPIASPDLFGSFGTSPLPSPGHVSPSWSVSIIRRAQSQSGGPTWV
jgi:hypothetical protein